MAVWISREVMVDLLLEWASLLASAAILSKRSLTKEFMMDMALEETPVSGWTCFSSDPLEKVVDEGVHDGHGLGGDAGVGVDLLQHLVDVDGVRLLPLALALLLVTLGDGLGGLARLGSSLAGSLGRHSRENERLEQEQKL